MNTKKGDSRHGGGVKRLLVLSLLAGCAHASAPCDSHSSGARRAVIALVGSPTWQADLAQLGDAKQVACYVRAAGELCQADANLSDGDLATVPPHDAVCIERAREWSRNANACGESK